MNTALPVEPEPSARANFSPFPQPHAPNIQLLRGRDGRDGLPGTPGAAGRNGRDGRDGEKGNRGVTGIQGPRGETGEQGPPAAMRGGVTYTRWGKTACPAVSGTELVYSGITAGSHYTHTGGGANYLCLPPDPEYGEYVAGVQNRGLLYGAEYETGTFHFLRAVHDYNVPCAVCYVSTRVTALMLPAKLECPTSWTLEYSGYLMSEYHAQKRTMFVCVDSTPDTIPGSSSNTNGALLYLVEGVCNGLPCGPYADGKEITCAVCTK